MVTIIYDGIKKTIPTFVQTTTALSKVSRTANNIIILINYYYLLSVCDVRMSEYCVQKPRECDGDDDTIARARAPTECDFIEFISILLVDKLLQ